MAMQAVSYDMDEVGRSVSQAVSLLRPRGNMWSIDLDHSELRAEGMAVALEALKRFDPARGSLGGYVYRIVKRQVGGWVARQITPASIPHSTGQDRDGVWKRYGTRVAFNKTSCPLSTVETPESLYLAAEGADRMVAWRADVAAEVRRVLATMTGVDRRIASRLWGLDGVPGDQSQGACGKLARRYRVRVETVYKVRDKLRRRMIDNQRLRTLMQELRDIRQTIQED